MKEGGVARSVQHSRFAYCFPDSVLISALSCIMYIITLYFSLTRIGGEYAKGRTNVNVTNTHHHGRRPVLSHPDHCTTGSRALLHRQDPPDPVPLVQGVYPRGHAETQQGGVRLIVPSADGFHSIPGGDREYHRDLHGFVPGRFRFCVLDVGHCHHRGSNGFHRKHPGSGLQTAGCPWG